MDIGPAERIGPYALLDRLGAGGMGQVYRARDVRLDRVVALKVLRDDRASDARSRQSLIDEARALSALNNTHVAALFDVVTHGGCDCLVMEYVPGSSLDRLLAEGPLKAATALGYAIQIADALAAAHAKGIIHRDLKPSNIAVTPDGSVKLLDFGIAKHVRPAAATELGATYTETGESPLTAPEGFAGTPAYMSPEQVNGRPLDARTDIFSFGTVLFEMLTGRRAFARETTIATVAAILHEKPAPVRELAPATPPELEAIVAGCLEKEPSRRFRRIADVKTLLERLADKGKSGALLDGGTGRPFSVRSLAIAGAAAAALIAGAVLGVRSYFAPPADEPLNAELLTSYPGLELSPSCSPDGSFVAFQWDGPKQNNWDIYVKGPGSGDPVRLTSDDADDISPAWSPDGRQIAFLRLKDDRASLRVIPALGGQERTVATLPVIKGYNWHLDGRTLAWTPDGKWIAAPRPDGDPGNMVITLVSAETGEMRNLTSMPAGSTGARDHDPAFSWDGRWLAFARSPNPFSSDLFLLALEDGHRPSGAPRQLTKGAGANTSPAWTPDGRDLVFESNRSGEPGLWKIDAAGRYAPRRLPGAGENGMTPAASRQGRLFYVNTRVQDTNIWRLPLEAAGATPSVTAFSSRTDSAPQISPDGRSIVFQSDRQGHLEIWMSNADGSRPVALTNFGRGHSGTPRWSPDGRRVVFDSNVSGVFQVYTVGVDGGQPRQLTSDRALAAIPSWSRDGRWIYFTSPKSGRDEVWKVAADGDQEPARVTWNGGSVPLESPDGSRLYFLRGGTVWSMPRDGGPERQEVEKVRYRNYAVAQGGIYFERETEATQVALCFFSFATGKTSELYRTARPTHMGLAVSPDEKFLYYTQVEQEGSDLMVADRAR